MHDMYSRGFTTKKDQKNVLNILLFDVHKIHPFNNE